MAVDMKEIIAEATINLLLNKNKKKITVRDIVEECNITRQAFYYHFADIPELIEWMFDKQIEDTMNKLEGMTSPEEVLRYLFVVALNMKPSLEKGLESNYSNELHQILQKHLICMVNDLGSRIEDCMEVTEREKNIFARYHSYAMLGLFMSWTDEDTEHLDKIVHSIYTMLTGRIDELSHKN